MFKFFTFVESRTQLFSGHSVCYSSLFSYATLQFDNLFSHSFLVDPNTQKCRLVLVIHFELYTVQKRMCCALLSSCVVVVIVFLQWRNKNVNS